MSSWIFVFISKIYPNKIFISAIFPTNIRRGLSKIFWIERDIVSRFHFFDSFIQKQCIRSSRRNTWLFLPEKKLFEEISAILQARHPGIRGYSVKTIKSFSKKRNFSRDLSRPYASNDFWGSCRRCTKELLQNLLFWVVRYTVFVRLSECY